jgi:hypothetical protein
MAVPCWLPALAEAMERNCTSKFQVAGPKELEAAFPGLASMPQARRDDLLAEAIAIHRSEDWAMFEVLERILQPISRFLGPVILWLLSHGASLRRVDFGGKPYVYFQYATEPWGCACEAFCRLLDPNCDELGRRLAKGTSRRFHPLQLQDFLQRGGHTAEYAMHQNAKGWVAILQRTMSKARRLVVLIMQGTK